MKAAKPSARRSVFDHDRPSNDMIKVSLRRLKADLQVAERLPSLAGDIVGDHAARAVYAVLRRSR
jgi:hypothetical protein